MNYIEIIVLFVFIIFIAILIHRLGVGLPSASIAAFFVDIEKSTKENNNWRKVLHTSGNLQTVVMNVPPGQELGWEVHRDSDQLFRIESGTGQIMVNNSDPSKGGINTITNDVNPSSLVVVPKGIYHNVVNSNNHEPLKFYTVYSPPHHPLGTVDKTHADEILREGVN
jgi:mannose-6-phosphate isomerase-like protein (cupin superfamily)